MGHFPLIKIRLYWFCNRFNEKTRVDQIMAIYCSVSENNQTSR